MITVITATHNHAPFLRGAIDSVRAQTFQDWEHLIIDDGSTDATPEILADLVRPGNQPADPRLRSIRTANQGFQSALNLGLAEAKGDLVAFLDSDDEYLPDHLGHLQETLGDRDFALGRFDFINCTGRPDPVLADYFNPGAVIEAAKAEYGTGVFFGRTELFRRLGGFRPVPLSDTDFFMRMKESGCAWVRAERPTYRYFFGRVPNNMATREMLAANLQCGR